MLKKTSEINRLRDIKTLQSSKRRSIPRVESSIYLDLYMLRKEKERLEKELFVLNKKRKNIEKRLQAISVEKAELERTEVKKREASCRGLKPASKKEWRTISIEY